MAIVPSLTIVLPAPRKMIAPIPLPGLSILLPGSTVKELPGPK
jgi:hypothetical protein